MKLHGQERPEEVAPEVRAAWQAGRTFHDKSVLSRAIVVAAGPVANFLLAMVLFAVLFATVGQPVAMPVIGEVIAGGAAEHAGLAKGDRITAIDGKPIKSFEDIQHIVAASPGKALELTLLRGGVEKQLPVTIGERRDGGQEIGVLGIQGGNAEYRRLDPARAVVAGVTQTWDVTRQTVVGIAQMIEGRRGTDDIGGPLRIAELSGQVAQLGLASLVSFIAVLSINLGLINLFPIPILDGGHLLFYLVEALRGRPVPARAREYGYRAGFALLACLFVFATWNDLTHLGLFRWVAGLIG